MSTDNNNQGFFSNKAFSKDPDAPVSPLSGSDLMTDSNKPNDAINNRVETEAATEKLNNLDDNHQGDGNGNGNYDGNDDINNDEKDDGSHDSNNGDNHDGEKLAQTPVSHYPKKTTLGFGEPLKLAIVGHTNTGKTSILRTLLRDKYFGEVKNAAATTRHVERAIITDNKTNENLVALYDTPGLEDASGVMDWLEDNTASRRDGIDRLQQFLASDLAQAKETPTSDSLEYDFSQEAKVIRQLLSSDIAIYVIDAREPVLGKYKDELTILSWSAVPVMPVYNFTTAEDNNINDWQTMLARRNLHVSTQFDSIAFEFEDEMRLWDNLATMLTDDRIVTQLIIRRKENWQSLHDEATIVISDFLLNVASFVREIDEEDDPLPILTEMQEAVRQAERNMHRQLTDLYKFYDSEVAPTPLSLSEYQQDPFDAELLKGYGIRTTSGAAAGALVGMGIDAAALGTTLGLGAALGGLAGGILSNTGKIADMITGKKHLYIDPETLTLLATRSLDLLYTLRHRGHAATSKIQYGQAPAEDVKPRTPWSADKLPHPLKKARNKTEWSSLGGANAEQAEILRKDMAWELSRSLSLE